MMTTQVTPKRSAVIGLIFAAFFVPASLAQTEAASPGLGEANPPAPLATDPEPAPSATVELWRLVSSAEPEAIAKLTDRLAAMTDGERELARRAVYQIVDVIGSDLELEGEVFVFPSAREWGRPFVDAVLVLPEERQVRVLESLDAMFYGVMRSRDSLVRSWRGAQQKEHGQEILDETELVLDAASPAEYLSEVPLAYSQAAWWRAWVANRLSELTADADLAAALAARSKELLGLVRNGRLHAGEFPPR